MDTLTLLQPKVESAPGLYVLTWPVRGHDYTSERPYSSVVFEASRLRAHSDGRLQGRVQIFVVTPDGRRVSVHHGQLNLAALGSREKLATTLETRVPTDATEAADWDVLVEESCSLVMAAEEQGEPVRRLERVASVDVEYLLPPILLDHLPNLLYAPGAAGKSMTAMLIALCVQNGLGLDGGQGRQAPVLYLDWESDPQEADRRATLLARGIERTHKGLRVDLPFYRRCTGSLTDQVQEVAKTLAEHSVGLVVIDSMAPAAGGDVLDAGCIIGLFDALRKATAATRAASLLLGHTSKEDRRSDERVRLPFGSVFCENLARSTWELRSQDMDRGLAVSMHCRKSNMGRHDPVGLHFDFGTEATLTRPADAVDVVTERGATEEMIKSELARGPMKVADVIEAVGGADDAVRMTLTRLKKRGQVVNPSRGIWALAPSEEER